MVQTPTREASAGAHQAAAGLSSEAQRLLEHQKETVASSLSSVARALHSVGQQLEPDQPQIAGYASSVASSVEQLSSSFRDRDFSDVKRQAEDFARVRPVLFLGGCVALGFALSRFLKASLPMGTPIGRLADESAKEGSFNADAIDPELGGSQP